MKMKNSKGSKTLAYIVALLTVIVWGETFVSSKILLAHGLRPADIFVFRFVIAYAGMWLLSHKKFLSRSWKDELLMLLLGIFGGSLYFLTENTALEYTTASNVAIILCATPLVTSILMAALYRDERMKRSQFAGAFVAIIGLAMIIFNGEVILKLNPLGDNLALGAVLCWGAYSMLMKRVAGRYDTAFVTRKVFGYGLLTILPYFVIFGWPAVLGVGSASAPGLASGAGLASASAAGMASGTGLASSTGMATASTAGLTSVSAAGTAVSSLFADPVVWGNLLYLGLVASLTCYLAWNWSLKVLGTVKTTNILYLQPFSTMVIGSLLLHERITWMAILGAVILIAGVYKVVK